MPRRCCPPPSCTTARAAVRYPRGSGSGAAVEPDLDTAADRQGRTAPPGQARWRCWPSAAMVAPALAAGRSTRRHASPTCASSSRWTRNWLRELAREPRPAGHARGKRRDRRRRRRGGRVAGRTRHAGAAAAPGPARPFHRTWRPGAAAGRSAAWMRPASSSPFAADNRIT